jgi:hypothetical protein
MNAASASEPLKIELDHFHLQPFQNLTGRIRRMGAFSATSLELRLFWFTRGRGDEDASIIQRQSVNPEAPEINFSWKLPAAPYSFAGQLITLAWAVELVDENEQSFDLVPFLLSPTGQELQLEAVPDKFSKKVFHSRKS